MIASFRSIPLTLLCVQLNAAQAAAQPVCKPTLTVQEESFSKVFNLRRQWIASVSIDASPCTTTSGLFSLGFIRLAENALDLAFVEPFLWRLGQKKVVVEFWANEAVHKYWVEDVATCPCRSN